MFNPNIDPKTVLNHVFQEMVEVLQRIESSGFPIQATPPHTSSIFLVFEEDSECVGIARAEPHVLSKIDQKRWLSLGVFHTQEKVKNTTPIGCFFGLLCSLENISGDETFFYVGILTSPTGEGAVGCCCPISNLSKTPHPLTDVSGQFEFLNETLQVSQHIH